MEIEKEKGRDKDAELKVKTNGINNVKRQVSISLFFVTLLPLSLCGFLCLSLSTDEIANDL